MEQRLYAQRDGRARREGARATDVRVAFTPVGGAGEGGDGVGEAVGDLQLYARGGVGSETGDGRGEEVALEPVAVRLVGFVCLSGGWRRKREQITGCETDTTHSYIDDRNVATKVLVGVERRYRSPWLRLVCIYTVPEYGG